MRCNIGYKQPEKMTRWTMFWYVVYYHCSDFQILRSLNGLHLSVLSLYPNSVQNRAWFCLHFSDHSKPKQTDVIFSRFVSLSLVNQGRFPCKNWPVADFSPLFIRPLRISKKVCHTQLDQETDQLISEIKQTTKETILFIPEWNCN